MRGFLCGLGFSSEVYSSLGEWLEGEAHSGDKPNEGRSVGRSLPPRVRRRASVATRMVADAFFQACRGGTETLLRQLASGSEGDASDRDQSPNQNGELDQQVPIVLCSAWGELRTTVELLKMMHVGDGRLSPTAFHNSVHNTSVGYLSIASKNQLPSTAIAAGADSLAMGLLEALLMMTQREQNVVLIVVDEAVNGEFPAKAADSSFAVAFYLSASKDMRTQDALSIELLRREKAEREWQPGPESEESDAGDLATVLRRMLSQLGFGSGTRTKADDEVLLDPFGANEWWLKFGHSAREALK